MIHSTIIGRLGKDPEARDTPKGEVVSFSVASDHGWGDKKTTTWVRVACFGQRAKFAKDYCRKGTLVAVGGVVYLREWEGKDGAKRVDLCCDASEVSKLSRDDEGGGGSKPARGDTGRSWGDDDGSVPF